MDLAEPTAAERLEIAKLDGAASYWGTGGGKDRPREEALADLLKISTSGLVWAAALGDALARVEDSGWTHEMPIVELLRMAEPDEQAAEHRREQQAERLRRFGGI